MTILVGCSNPVTRIHFKTLEISETAHELNSKLAPSKISFKLEGVTRTINANWTIDTEGSELEMKKALRKGDYKTLNIYFQKRLWEEALGVSLLAFVPFENRTCG